MIYKALHASPMIPSYNLEETTRFFTDLFGFSIHLKDGNYAVLYKDSITIHLLNAGTDIGEMEFYLEVDDINGLWLSIQDKLADLNVRAPFDREYGMRELHIIVPQTKTLMFVGQVINNQLGQASK
jgi:hypothetical protein